MKKLLLVATLSVFAVLAANAQQLSYGVKAGANSGVGASAIGCSLYGTISRWLYKSAAWQNRYEATHSLCLQLSHALES